MTGTTKLTSRQRLILVRLAGSEPVNQGRYNASSFRAMEKRGLVARTGPESQPYRITAAGREAIR